MNSPTTTTPNAGERAAAPADHHDLDDAAADVVDWAAMSDPQEGT